MISYGTADRALHRMGVRELMTILMIVVLVRKPVTYGYRRGRDGNRDGREQPD